MKANFWHRLINNNDQKMHSAITMQEYLNMLCQDIMLLLNSKRTNSEKLDGLLNYGLTDLARLNPQSEQDKSYIQSQIQHILEEYEPRLNNILVLCVDADDQKNPQQMTFRIKANLLMPSGTPQISIDSIIDTPTGEINIQLCKEKTHE